VGGTATVSANFESFENLFHNDDELVVGKIDPSRDGIRAREIDNCKIDNCDNETALASKDGVSTHIF
jgi:hypothetical protein